MSLEHSPQRTARYLRASAAAEYIGLSPSTLAKMRVRGDSPPYAKAGPRVVIYDIDDLDGWLAARKRRSTSDTLGETKQVTVAT